jgi:hypothetical protein
LQFEVSNNLQWKISNVWVQYLDKGWNQKRKELKLQSDGTYIVAFSSDSCSWCTDLKPYYLLSWRTDIFIASSGNNIEIANSAYKQFQDILTSIWNWKWYSKEWLKEEIIELKEDYDDYASLTVSLFPWVWEVYDIW